MNTGTQRGLRQPRPLRHQGMHLVYRLKGSLPRAAAATLFYQFEADLLALERQFGPLPRLSAADLEDYQQEDARLRTTFEEAYDLLLDEIRNGPRFLDTADAKKIVLDSWQYFEQQGLVELFAISVMSNHVHVLLQHPEPEGCLPISDFLPRHQEFTAFQLNRLQDRKGRRVWAPTFYDRDIRDNTFEQVLFYIVNNPVKAGLTKKPLEWSGTYVASGCRELLTGCW